MTLTETRRLGDLMAAKNGSVDPKNFPDETFDLYSIPAFDSGKPDVVAGSLIGSSKQIVGPGDVLLSKIVPHIRRTWIVGEERGRRIIASGEWIVFRHELIHPPYLRHFLKSDEFHAEFMSTVAGVGGSLLRARPSSVSRLMVRLPNLQKQRRIAAILDQAEALRTKRRQALAKLDTLTQSLFLEMFGEAARGASTWPFMYLPEIAELKTGFPFLSDDYVDHADAIKLCRGANVLPGRIDWSDLAGLSNHRSQDFPDYVLREGDVLVAMDRPWINEGFKIARIRPQDSGALLVQRVARLRALSDVSSRFLYEILKSSSFTRHCRPTETTVPHISPRDFRSFKTRIPPRGLMERFERTASTIDVLKERAHRSYQESSRLFASLQHRAFQGEL
jgi:type I restriction enzyme, S subunit